MKKTILIIMLLCSALAMKAQPGKYAGTMKKLIKTVYTDSRNIPGLSGWTFMQGSVLSQLHEPEMILVDVYRRGTAYIVFFSISSDTASAVYTIYDVLEIRPLPKGWIIKTSFCRQNGVEDPWIVALAKPSSTEFIKLFKNTWRFNRDKRQIDMISTKGVACLNEGFDVE